MIESDVIKNLPTILSIIGPILAAVLYIDKRHREDLKAHKEDTQSMENRHREDIQEMSSHWRELFMYMNNQMRRRPVKRIRTPEKPEEYFGDKK